jgi:hypothetical protein
MKSGPIGRRRDREGAYEDGTDSVPKRRHIKFGRQRITQKKEYNIHNRAKVVI